MHPPAVPRLLVAAVALAAVGASCGGGGGYGGGGPGVPPPPPPVLASGCDEVPLTALTIPDLSASPGPTRGTVVLRFTAPAAPGGGRADSYAVRAQVRHITDANLASVPVVPQSTVPGAPGAPEAITLSGLEPGQTMQFAVQAVKNGVPAAYGYAVSSRVTEGTPPAPPGNAIPVSGPGTLSVDGAYYLLTQDVTAPGTGFFITGRNVTFDLGGHTITYGTGGARADGIHSEYLANSGKTTILDGRIVQSPAAAADSPAIWFRSGHDIRISHVDVTVASPDSAGISINQGPTGDIRIDHCVVDCRTTVVSNRHYPGVSAIWVEGAPRAAEIDHNWVKSSPQWGIKVTGPTSSGDVTVHHNLVTGTKALVANGYMIGVHKPAMDVFENRLVGESRGIHCDDVDNFGRDARIHDNLVRVQDQTNPEYSDFHWVHGIKLEEPPGVKVFHNVVIGVADDQHAEVRCLDVDCWDAQTGIASGIEVHHNRFVAIATGERFQAHALQWTAGARDDVTNDIDVCHNVFVATDRLIEREWSSGRGGLVRDCVFVRDLSLGASHPFVFERFDVSEDLASHGHRIRDAVTTESLSNVTQWASPDPYDSTREWTLAVVATDAGLPLAGATVTARDVNGTLVVNGTTDAAGLVAGPVIDTIVSNGPTFTDLNPYQVTVTKAGVGTWSGPVTVRARTALRVDPRAGTSVADSTPPSAPSGLWSRALSASRGLLRWTASTDDSGVAGYLVHLDGEVVGTTDTSTFVLFGLEPGTTHVPAVEAFDLNGNRTSVGVGPAFERGPEDRGP